MAEESTASGVKSNSDYEAELRAANEIVYKHSLELARLTKELAEANAAQENLLHFISHEVKGYLTKSEAAFAAISEGDYGIISPKLKEMAVSGLADVRRGVSTVVDILDASNLKKGTVSFNKAPFDFKTAILSVTADEKQTADEKHLALDVQIAEGRYIVNGDEEKLRAHVIRNLIDNAVKYTPQGTIKIELAQSNDSIRFSVQDNGVGITPEDMTHLFTEGGHGKDSIKINVHSTGYGLYIAKQVVDAHGGKIWAESEGQGKGARFVVELPTT